MRSYRWSMPHVRMQRFHQIGIMPIAFRGTWGPVTLPDPSFPRGYNTLNNWEALGRFIEDVRLPLDNNAAESALRRVALGPRTDPLQLKYRE